MRTGEDEAPADPGLEEIIDGFNRFVASQDTQASFDRLIRFLEDSGKILDALDTPETVEQDARREETAFTNGKGLLTTASLVIHAALKNPDHLARHYGAFAAEAVEILEQKSDLAPDPHDRRFKDRLWRDSAFLRSLVQIYLAWQRHLERWLAEQDFSEADRARVRFLFNQVVSAVSPSNFPLNPKALKRAERTQGKSAVKGLVNWISDAVTNNGMPRQVGEHAYVLGRDIAATAGDVVFRNEVLELIQYRPQTGRVHRRPMLLIPPQINKYYIFDLKEKNSILGYLVRQGFQMFVASWRNPAGHEKHWGLETYIKALLEAIYVMQSITRSKKVNIISACAGGLTAQVLLGYLATVDRQVVNAQSLLVTALTPNNNSILELFSSEQNIRLARAKASVDGYMDGKALARVFAWLRPDDLVWNYWVNNYLMGLDPPPLDVLFWDNDSTRLPARLHGEFIDIFEQDIFRRAPRQELFGILIDYGRVRVNTYVAAGDEDYLMPWKGVYQAARLFRGNNRFVLSRSGHVQSILRPPHLARVDYLAGDRIPPTPEQWLQEARVREGTWWHDWVAWLRRESGALKQAPRAAGNADYPPIMPAPGQYVLQK